MSHFLALAFVGAPVAQKGPSAIVDAVHRVMTLYTATMVEADSPDSPVMRWDGWHIGGRYAGLAARATTSAHSDASLDPESAALASNMCPVRDLPDELVPFAVITPNGRCLVEGTMGPFGYPYDLDPYWEDTYDALREQYAACTAVFLDCHI